MEKDNGYKIERKGNDVCLDLHGHFTAVAAEAATEKFTELVGSDTVRFVVDLGNMTSYDREARVRWQETLKPLRSQISIIIFIGDAPPLIRMAASAVALAVGVRMRFIASDEELD